MSSDTTAANLYKDTPIIELNMCPKKQFLGCESGAVGAA